MFVVQNPRNLNILNIDRFIERKKIADPSDKELGMDIKKQVFLIVDATLFDKECAKNNLEFCFLDVFNVFFQFFNDFL